MDMKPQLKYLVAAIALQTIVAQAEDTPMAQGDLSRRTGEYQDKIDYSKTLVPRKDLKSWVIEQERLKKEQEAKERAAGKDDDAPGWVPASVRRAEEKRKLVIDPDAVITDQGIEGAGEPTDPEAERLKALEAALHKPVPPAGYQPPKPAAAPAPHRTRGDGKVRYIIKPRGMGEQGEGQATYQMNVDRPDKTILFGITIGTRIPVKLDSGATNVQPGLVQVTVLRDVQGTKGVLERGSSLFLQVNAVPGSSRLFGDAVQGITRVHKYEFGLNGNIFADDGQPGFAAVVLSDGKGVQRAVDKGLSALGKTAVQVAANGAGTGVAGAGTTAADSLLDEKDDKNRLGRGTPNFVVQAEPQAAFIQVGETF